jgi:hypothetical protein
MTAAGSEDRIEDVSPGDIIGVDRGSGEKPYKVVFLDPTDTGYVVTFEDEHGETFQLDIAADTLVHRSLESKWESAQSPTTHNETPPSA